MLFFDSAFRFCVLVLHFFFWNQKITTVELNWNRNDIPNNNYDSISGFIIVSRAENNITTVTALWVDLHVSLKTGQRILENNRARKKMI